MRKIHLLTICCLVNLLSLAQTPANDFCADATLVLDNGSCNTGSILAGSDDGLVGSAGCATAGNNNQHKDVGVIANFGGAIEHYFSDRWSIKGKLIYDLKGWNNNYI